jgi:hypothetical protein
MRLLDLIFVLDLSRMPRETINLACPVTAFVSRGTFATEFRQVVDVPNHSRYVF